MIVIEVEIETRTTNLVVIKTVDNFEAKMEYKVFYGS